MLYHCVRPGMTLAATTLLCCAAQAATLTPGLAFTSTPEVSNLSTSNCTNPALVTYTVENVGTGGALTLKTIQLSGRNLGGSSAATIVPSSSNSCIVSESLAQGASCNITVSLQPCETGTLNRTLKVAGGSSENKTIASTLISAPVSEPALAYVVNYGSGFADGSGTVLTCPLNTDGSLNLSSCDTASLDVVLNGPANMTLNPDQTVSYISNFGNFDGDSVTICPMNGDGSFGTPCVNSTGPDDTDTGTFVSPNGVRVNAAGTYLYVANGGTLGTNNISICPILSGTSLDVCVTDNAGGTLNGPNGIALNSTQAVAYIVSYYTNELTVCDVNEDGTFSDCTINDAEGNLNGAIDVEVDPTDSNIYITNLIDNSVASCPLNSDGSIGSPCAKSIPTVLSAPGGASISPSFAYVSNNNNNTVSVCPVSGGVVGSTCNNQTSELFNTPNDVLLYQYP